MVAPPLHTALLLALLAASCPGSRATATQRLCGPHLADALHLVCGDRGFLFMPRTDDNPALRLQTPVAVRAASAGGEDEAAEFPSKDHPVKRSIVERCCLSPCSLYDLENYCF